MLSMLYDGKRFRIREQRDLFIVSLGKDYSTLVFLYSFPAYNTYADCVKLVIDDTLCGVEIFCFNFHDVQKNMNHVSRHKGPICAYRNTLL